MAEKDAHLVLKIDTKDPIELREFVSLFVGLGNKFEQHYAREHSVARGTAKFYIREIRSGSIIAELVPYFMPASAGLAAGFAAISKANELVSFVENISKGFKFLRRTNGRLPGASKTDLNDYLRTVEAVAHDPDASLSLAVFDDGEKQISFGFNTQEARRAETNLLQQKREMETVDDADHQRVLMVFTRTNVAHAKTGQKSGELVEIESLHPRPLPIVYASKLAEERIRHEVADADENVYKKAFDVDVNVELRGGKPIAYRLVAVHSVIDMPDQ